MSKSLTWRAGGALLIIFLSVLYLVPSVKSELPSWWSKLFLPQDRITLGLDLQGGMHLVLEVETWKAVESHLERTVEEIRQDLRREKLRYLELRRVGTEDILLTLMRE